jgi:glycosyltransferase involved in cell wall biosynthesis
MDVKVTIAIPTYKRLDYLREAVSSALAQNHHNIEVLISQDPTENGLDDSIRTWCQNLANQDLRVRYRFNAHNLGLAGNWNACVDAAEGEYIVIIGDDDRLLPNFVETLLSAADLNTNVVFSNHYLINSQSDRLEQESYQWTKKYQRDLISPGLLIQPERSVWQNSIPISASLIRTQDAQKLRFKEDLNTPEIEFFIRLAQLNSHFVFVPEYLAEYRVHQNSATTAGLRIEKLVQYLLEISITPEMELYKQELLSPLMINAVSRCILQKQWQKAQELIHSEYYPRQKKHLNILIQKFCTKLPPFLGCQLYRLVHHLKQQIYST